MARRPTKDYPRDTVLALLGSIRGPVTITVTEGSWAWNPASTRQVIWGPIEARYVRYPDGDITVITGHFLQDDQ